MERSSADLLKKYREKRDFSKTSEPAGESKLGNGATIFVVQKHHASRLHYDFRLEHNGALMSWAVPKGPSLDPKMRRLAVHVEDHPLDYATFEGQIPKGEYGAGTVIVWDHGTWAPLGDFESEFAKGHFKFRLEGTRLKGAWTLVKLKPKEADDDNWLLIKEKDDEAIPGDEDGIIVRETTSVQKGNAVDVESKSVDASLDPLDFTPQLATLVSAVPEGNDWSHEIKYDGYRIVAWREADGVRLVSRNGHNWTDRFPSLAGAVAQTLPAGVTVDGEVVVLDKDGKSDFGCLQRWLKDGKGASPLYFVFDLILDHGKDVRHLPLKERKLALQKLLRAAPELIRFSDHVIGNGREFFERVHDLGLEGVVSKRLKSPYRSLRTSDWQKTKIVHQEEFVVGGYTRGEGARSQLGALLLGQFDSARQLQYSGKVGSGLSDADVSTLSEALQRLEVKEPEFVGDLSEVRRGAHWVRPVMVVEVRYAERTAGGSLRHPVFVGLREDKEGATVKPENVVETLSLPIKLTHPDRVLFSDIGLTKQGLAEYYAKVADRMVEHIEGRALALVRCPEGVGEPCFFQKHLSPGMSKHLETKVSGEDEPVIIADTAEDVLEFVQFGGIEFHPWGSLAKSIESPDTMVFDLDPGPDVDWQAVVQATQAVGERLRDLGLFPFVKTSGGKGFHVVVPLKAGTIGWDDLKRFSRAVSVDMDKLVPGHFVTKMTKSIRAGKIFIDFFRNNRGSTSVAPYSVRAREGAPVSVPIEWNQVANLANAHSFTVLNVSDWLTSPDDDPWREFRKSAKKISAEAWRELGEAIPLA